MRKNLLLILFCLLISRCGYSQVSFGVKSGINIATTKDLITFPKNRLGWYAGGGAKIQIHKKFFLQPELLYSSKGYRFEDLSDGKTVAMRLNYLAFPILFGYGIDSKTNILLGTELANLIKASLIKAKIDERINATSSFPVKFDIGIAIGLTYNIKKNIGAEVRYIYGFKQFYQVDAVGIRRGEGLS